jgi:hypothetical protein
MFENNPYKLEIRQQMLAHRANQPEKSSPTGLYIYRVTDANALLIKLKRKEEE